MSRSRSVWRTANSRCTFGVWIGALLMLSACGLSGPAHQPPPSDVAAVVEMTNGLNFSPDKITLPAGGTVEWRNISFFTHTVTADPARASDPDDVQLPPGAEPFNSGEIPAGEVFRRRFTTPGTYRYFCIPHEGMGMIGTIIVEPAT